MWHASGRGRSYGESRLIVKRALADVGDAELGEWWEHGEYPIMHLKRRLTDAEAEIVGEVRDIRGTPEAAEIVAELLSRAPYLAGRF